ncbi:MAG TPA: GNAT family N-acetyltransferase [Methyloceanibacter sp.]|nr:GNAT family N-acetyltransferase [Methyloceanibacter sp.]
MLVAIIQARMTSTRLPGKVLAELAGQPMLTHMISRVRRANRLDALWVATTVNATDDPVADLCKALDVPVFRGDEHDVLGRHVGAAQAAGATSVMRLTADCPMVDPELLDQAAETFLEGHYDYYSNALVRTYPDGLDLEIFTNAALMQADREADTVFHREHVTPYLRTGSYDDVATGKFRVGKMIGPADFGHLRWTVDTHEDLARVRRLVAELPDNYGWLDVIALLTRQPELLSENPREALEVRLRPATESDSDLLLEWVNSADSLAHKLQTSKPISRAAHEAWLASRLVSPDAGIWIAETTSAAVVGQVRLEKRNDTLEVDIYVDPSFRGSGVAKRMLDAARLEAGRRWPGVAMVARVKNDNWASRRLFNRAGYGGMVQVRDHVLLRRDPPSDDKAAR